MVVVDPLLIRRDDGVEETAILGAAEENSGHVDTCRFVCIADLMWYLFSAAVRLSNCMQMVFDGAMCAYKRLRKFSCCLARIQLDGFFQCPFIHNFWAPSMIMLLSPSRKR